MKDNLTKYVLGFMLSQEYGQVALIKKQRPAWQHGLLNGIGGHIEEGERAVVAMAREFAEETGVQTITDSWIHRLTMVSDSWICLVYAFMCDCSLVDVGLRTMTDEEVVVYSFPLQEDDKMISNLRWIIPLLLDQEAPTLIHAYYAAHE